MTRIEKSNRTISIFVVCLDAIIINLLFLAFRFIWLQYREPIVEGSLVEMLLSLTVSYAISAIFGGVNLYYRRVRTDQIFRKTVSDMIIFAFAWLVISSIFEISIGLNRPMRLYFLTSTVFVVFIRLTFSAVLKHIRTYGRNRCNVIYVGSGSNLMELYNEMALQLATGYNVLGYFDSEPNPKFDKVCKYLGQGEEVVDYLQAGNVDRVYCGLPSKERATIIPIINFCEGHLIRFFSVPNFRNYCHRRVSLEMFSNVPLLTIREEPLGLAINRYMKRLFDIAFSLCFLCTAFIPVFLIAGLLTKLSSPGPIFFKQKRHGLDGKEFYMYKFRSMRVNRDADSVQATENDPRKTKWGDFMRKTSIDELPQFINVFLGNMSIVGPRPHMVKHTEEYSELIDTYMVRHFIKPGVTGWAQVTGFRGETKELSEMEGRVKADIWYMEHWTFTLDLYIIYKTIANVVGRKDKKAF